MSKPTLASRAAAGVFEAVRDLYKIYGGDGDDNTVAFLEAPANELAQPADSGGTVVNTTTALGTTTYTSATFRTQGFGRIVGICYSDVAGTLKVEQSADGTNFDLVASVAVTAGTGQSFSEEVVAPYARLSFTPGSSQSTFRLYPFLRRLGSA